MNRRLHDLRDAFRAGTLDKHQYSAQMHAIHSILFSYADFLRGSCVARVEIADGRVIVVHRNGMRLACNPDDRYIPPIQLLNFGKYEAEECEMLDALAQPGDTILDIGANVGWYSLHFARKLPTSRVYAFEPIPTTFRSLEENVWLNDQKNVSLHNFGLSDKEATMTFYLSPDESGAASAVNIREKPDAREVLCRVRRLDDVRREFLPKVDLIKCDVEGAEIFVFRGGMECIASDQPVIFCEMLRKWSAKFRYRPNDIIALLGSVGYRCYEIEHGRLQRLQQVDDETVATNFVFLHGQRHERLIHNLVIDG